MGFTSQRKETVTDAIEHLMFMCLNISNLKSRGEVKYPESPPNTEKKIQPKLSLKLLNSINNNIKLKTEVS